MNRKRRFLTGLLAGYAAFGANLLFTLISVPLALHYLPKAEFGLWALVVQIGGYLALLDMGMTSSVARFLADHKDSMDRGEYGEILKTGRWVFGLLALLVVLFTLGSAYVIPSFLDTPASLVMTFQILIVGQGCIQAVGLALRAESSPLWAHQRIDITHWATSANLVTSLLVMASGFMAGWGVYSFLAGAFAGSLWSWFFPWVACQRLGLFPAKKAAGKFEVPLLARMIGFGRDVLLMQLGGVICSASPLIIVSKVLGLEAAATYSVATKMLTMGQQLLGRILESAAPGLTELFVRGDKEGFVIRFYQMTLLSVSLATLLGISLMSGNREFVFLWTHGSITWGRAADILLASLLIATVTSRCFQGAFGMSADLAKVRYLPLAEGSLFIILAVAFRGTGGMEGVLALSLACQLVVGLGGSSMRVISSYPYKPFWRRAPWCITGIFLILSILSIELIPQDCQPHEVFLRTAFLVSGSAILIWFGLLRTISR